MVNPKHWFAPRDLTIGDRFQETIEQNILKYEKLLLVLSKASVNSRWVEREVQAAREREDREGCEVVFPVRIDDEVIQASQAWAADLRRTRHIGTFENWRDSESYKRGLERIIRDLRIKAKDHARRSAASL